MFSTLSVSSIAQVETERRMWENYETDNILTDKYSLLQVPKDTVSSGPLKGENWQAHD